MLTEVCLVKAMVFLVVMCRCESWTIKKKQSAEELMLLKRRLLRVPWTEKTSNQSILKEISPEYSLEGSMLKLKLQNFGYLMLGKIEGKRKRGRQRMRRLDALTD